MWRGGFDELKRVGMKTVERRQRRQWLEFGRQAVILPSLSAGYVPVPERVRKGGTDESGV